MSRFDGVGRLAIDYGGGGQKLRTFQMTPLSPNCSRKFMTGSVVVARPFFVARHRSVSNLLAVLVQVGAVGAPGSADVGDEAFDREPLFVVGRLRFLL